MMKKIFISIGVLLTLFVLSVIIYCACNRLDGIFELKLGMSEQELREVVDVTLLKESSDNPELRSDDDDI